MRRLLVLRPEPDASATLDRARRLGLDAFSVPLFAIEPVTWESVDPDAYDGLLMTSANTVRYAGEKLKNYRHLPVYAVGTATADAAGRFGFKVEATGHAGVDHLLDLLGPEIKLLHFGGEDRRTPAVSNRLITPVAVYAARPVLAPDLSEAPGSVALIHSPRSGRRFAELIGQRESICIAAISEASARSAGSGWAAVEAADEANEDALLALAARLCNISLQK